MRRRARIDDNHGQVVAALEKVGCLVQSLAALGNGVPDLLVGRAGKLFLLEVKPGSAKDKRQRTLNALETQWHRRWHGFPVHVVLSPEDALAAVGLRDVRARIEANAAATHRQIEATLQALADLGPDVLG